MNRRNLVLLAALAASATVGVTSAFGAAGDFDTSFGFGGAVRDDFSGASVSDLEMMPDGDVIVAGRSNLDDPDEHAGLLARYTSTGGVRTTYAVIGSTEEQLFDDPTEYEALAARPDGRVVAVGTRNDSDSSFLDHFTIAQYTATGVLDTAGFASPNGSRSFQFHGGGDGFARDVALDSDGDAVVVGMELSLGNENFAVARVLTNGNPDGTFGGGDGFLDTEASAVANNDDGANAVAINPSDGDILAAGSADGNTADGHAAVTRYASTGTPDAAFGGGTGEVRFDVEAGTDDSIADLAILPDGKILVAGRTGTGAGIDHFVARLEPDGDLDPTFGDGGDGVTQSTLSSVDQVDSLAVMPSGQIAVIGDRLGKAFVTRYSATGIPDAAFGNSGTRTLDFGPDSSSGNTLAALSDGRLMIGGTISGDAMLARLKADDPPPAIVPPAATPTPQKPKCKKGQKLKKGKCVKKKRRKRK
jgi:uncharacterized delta-60 repeat protein